MRRAPTGARRFWTVLLLIVVAALGIRVIYVAKVAVHDHAFYDAAYYHLQANKNAEGDWYRNPFPFTRPDPAADHPPLTALVLTPVAFVIPSPGDNLVAMRYVMAVLGAGVVVIIGLLGREVGGEVGGEVVGWVAAGLAAVYPFLWVNDGLVMAETLAAGLTAGAILLTYRYRRRPRLAIAVALGVVCGLAALARAELVLLVPLLAVLTPVLTRGLAWPRRLRAAGCGLLASVVVVAPWVGWNLSRFDDPVFLSTNDGTAIRGATCDAVFSGPDIGYWRVTCVLPIPHGDPSVQSTTYRDEAWRYLRAHVGRYPAVVAARLGRMWGIFRPLDAVRLGRGEGRARWVSGLGLAFYYPVVVLAIAGVFVLRRRRVAWWPLAIPAVIVTLEVLPAYGWPRLRLPAEPSLVVLASVAGVAAAERMLGARRRAAIAAP